MYCAVNVTRIVRSNDFFCNLEFSSCAITHPYAYTHPLVYIYSHINVHPPIRIHLLTHVHLYTHTLLPSLVTPQPPNSVGIVRSYCRWRSDFKPMMPLPLCVPQADTAPFLQRQRKLYFKAQLGLQNCFITEICSWRFCS